MKATWGERVIQSVRKRIGENRITKYVRTLRRFTFFWFQSIFVIFIFLGAIYKLRLHIFAQRGGVKNCVRTLWTAPNVWNEGKSCSKYLNLNESINIEEVYVPYRTPVWNNCKKPARVNVSRCNIATLHKICFTFRNKISCGTCSWSSRWYQRFLLAERRSWSWFT